MHDRIRDDTASTLRTILLTAGIIGKGSRVDVEPKHIIKELPNLRPFDSWFRPVPSLKRTTVPPIPYTCVGLDFTITSPKGHVPPSKRSRAPKKPAPAAKHLISKERPKLMRNGKSDPYNFNSLTGEEIIERLLIGMCILLPVAISPYGRWGPMFHNFLFGRMKEIYKFPKTRPNAEKMYNRAMNYPAPIGIIPLATATWKKEKPKQQYFYGHSYTSPTPREYAVQNLGLAISNAVALHIRDAREGLLVPPTHEDDEDFDLDDDNEQVHTDAILDEDDDELFVTAANRIFDVGHTVPIADDTLHPPPGFEVGPEQLRGGYDFVDASCLWTQTTPRDTMTTRVENATTTTTTTTPVPLALARDNHTTQKSTSRLHSWTTTHGSGSANIG